MHPGLGRNLNQDSPEWQPSVLTTAPCHTHIWHWSGIYFCFSIALLYPLSLKVHTRHLFQLANVKPSLFYLFYNSVQKNLATNVGKLFEKSVGFKTVWFAQISVALWCCFPFFQSQLLFCLSVISLLLALTLFQCRDQ